MPHRGANRAPADVRGDCRADRVRARAHGYGKKLRSGEERQDCGRHRHGGEPQDRHGHEHGHEHHHAEFHIMARLHCDRPERLRWIDLDLFERFPGNEALIVDVLTDSIQTRARLEPGRTRVSLR